MSGYMNTWYRYTALQKFGNALENGFLKNIGMNPF